PVRRRRGRRVEHRCCCMVDRRPHSPRRSRPARLPPPRPQEASRSLWSVNSQSASRGSEGRISNGPGGSGEGFDTPTVFVSLNLPGLVFVHPALHHEATPRGKQSADAFTTPWSAVEAHASGHPEHVAVLNAPATLASHVSLARRVPG